MSNIKIITYRNNQFLFINNDLWMWDTPRERALQRKLSRDAYGDVLVAGYGFGLIVRYLFKNKRVKSITIAEKHKNILNALKRRGAKIYGNVQIIDFYKLPETKKYDCIVGDIWQDIDPYFLKDYLKFKKKASRLVKKNGKILAWGKEYFEYLLKIQK